MKGEKGFALVITLVITALLVALTTQFIDDVYVETSSRQNFIDGQQASLMANSGIDGALKLLDFSLSGRSYTTLSDQWAKPLQWEDEKGSLKVTIEDESAKIDLNRAVNDFGKDETSFYYKAAVRLFKKTGVSLDLLDALADWRDTNDTPLPGGAETTYYMQLKQPYKAKNGKVETVEELSLIRGFDAAALGKIRPFVTVYPVDSTAAPININTAPREVLLALSDDMTDELAKRIIDYRTTTPFKIKGGGDIANVPGMQSMVMQLQLYIDVTSSLYHVTSVARVGETERTVEAVVQTGGSQPFLYWREF